MKQALIVRLKSLLLTTMTVMSILTLIPTSVFAFDEDFYSSNDILFYNPDDTTCSTNSTGLAVGGGTLPAATTSYLDAKNIKSLVQQNMARYQYAQDQTGVPWQVVAALHYREGSMNANQSVFNGAALGSGINVDGQNVVSDPNQDAANAAKHFVSIAKGVYNVDPSSSPASLTTEQWGEAFLAYNRGFLYKQNGHTYNDSPYVMNGFDDAHMNMKWVGPPADPAASGTDGNKAGALAVLLYIGGISLDSSCASTAGAVKGNIVQTALNYAVSEPVDTFPKKYPDPTDPSIAKASYRDAIQQYDGQAPTDPEITDCGRFVATVMRASGADTDFPAVYVSTQRDYMASSSKYTNLGPIDMSQMQPGDIITYIDASNPEKGHIMIYTGQNNGYVAVDASLNQRVPSVRDTTSLQWMINQTHEVWRLK